MEYSGLSFDDIEGDGGGGDEAPSSSTPAARPVAQKKTAIPVPQPRPDNVNGDKPAWDEMSFDDLKPEESGMLSVGARATARGIADAAKGVVETGKVATGGGRDMSTMDALKPSTDDKELDHLLEMPLSEGWKNANWWTSHIMHGVASASPTIGGAMAGGALGAEFGPAGALGGAAAGGAVGAAIQTLGPAYLRARNEGLSHDASVDRAIVETGIATVFGGAMGAAPGVSVFGKDAMGAVKKPISEALFQIFGAQPALGVAQSATTRVATGKKLQTLGELGSEYVENAAVGVAMTAAHAALPNRPQQVSERGPALDEAAALKGQPTTTEAAPTVEPAQQSALEAIRASRDKHGLVPEGETPPAAAEPPAPPPEAPPAPPQGAAPTPPAGPSDAASVTPEVTKRPLQKEAPDTLRAQREELIAGNREVMLYPPGTQPESKKPQKMRRVLLEIPGEGTGTFDYNPKFISLEDIRQHIADGTLNEMLGLGPKNKEAVAESAAKGNPEAAVVERNAEGTPVREAAATTETAPETQAAMEAKAPDENTVKTVPAEDVIAERKAANSGINIKDVASLLPKDAKGSTDWQALARVIKEVTGEEVGFGKLRPDHAEAVVKRLQEMAASQAAPAPATSAPAPAAPAPAPKVTAPKAEQIKSVSKARTEATKPAEKPVAKVEPKVETKTEVAKPATSMAEDIKAVNSLLKEHVTTEHTDDRYKVELTRSGDLNLVRLSDGGEMLLLEDAASKSQRDVRRALQRGLNEAGADADRINAYFNGEAPATAPKAEKAKQVSETRSVESPKAEAPKLEAPKPEPSRTAAENFRENYNSKKNKKDQEGMWLNPDLKDFAKYADWLGSLSDAQWKKLEPVFTNADNPFLLGFNMGMDPVALRTRFEKVVGETPKAADIKAKSRAKSASEDLARVESEQKARAEANKPKEETKPVSESEKPRAPRILESQDEASQKAREETSRRIADNIKASEKEVAKAEAEPKGKNWDQPEIDRRAHNNAEAKKIVEEFPPTDAEKGYEGRDADARSAREAILARARKMVAEVEKRLRPDDKGERLFGRLRDGANEEMNHSAEMIELREARDLVAAADKKKGLPEKKHFDSFLSRMELLRKGERELVKQDRKIAGEEKTKVDQGNVEELGAAEDIAAHDNPEENLIRKQEEGEESTFKSADEAYEAGRERESVFDKHKQELSEAIKNKITKLEAMRDDAATTPAEKETASKLIERLKDGENVDININAFVQQGVDKAGTFKVEKSRRIRRARGMDGELESDLHPAEGEYKVTSLGNSISLADLNSFAGRANKATRGMMVKILEHLKKKLGDTEVRIVSQEVMDRVNPNKRPGSVDAYYDPNEGYIAVSERFVKDGKIDGEVLSHEGMHALVDNGIANDPRLRADMQALLDFVKEQGGEKFQGLKNVNEMAAEIFNPEFSDYMMKVKLSKELSARFGMGEKTGSLWDGFVQSVARFLGLRPNEFTALDGLMKLASRAEVATDRVRAEESRYGDLMRSLSSEKGNSSEIESELIKRGVQPREARQLSDMILSEFGDTFDMKKAMPVIKDVAEQFAKEKKANIDYGNSGKVDDAYETFREHLMDFNRPLERLQEQVEKQAGEKLTDEERFYEKKRLMQPKVQAKLQQITNKEMAQTKELIRDAEKAGMTFDDVGKALTALHAEERNTFLADRQLEKSLKAEGIKDSEAKRIMDNPAERAEWIEEYGIAENLSGMETQDAKALIERIEAKPEQKAILDRAVELNKRLRDIELNTLQEGGLLSKESVDRLRGMYENFTSLKGFADEEIAAEVTARGGSYGREGMSLFGKDIRSAEGRTTESDNPLHNMFQNARRAVERAEFNKVLKSAADAIEKADFDSNSPMHITRNPPGNAVSNEKVLAFRDKGVTKYLVFRDAELAQTFSRVSADELPGFLKYANKATNVVKGIWTHYSPTFLARHFVFRYPIEGAMNLKALKEYGADTGTVGYMKDAFGSIGDIYRYLEGKEPLNAKNKQYIKEMAENGGIVSFKDLSDFNIKKKLENLAEATWKNPIEKMKNFHEAWETMLTAADAAERFAVYSRAREAGMTPQQAAIRARDATVDFARRGRSAGWMNLWVPFGNVGLQTTARFSQNMKSRSFRNTVFGIMAATTAIEMFNYMHGGKDKDGTPWVDKLPGFMRTQNLTMVTPFSGKDGKPIVFTLPLPYPLFAVNAAGAGAAQLVASKTGVSKLSSGDIATRVFHGAAETFTPLGHQIGNLSTLATPELARWTTELGSNRDWKGDNIHTDRAKPGLAKSEQGYKSTDQSWKTIAGVLSKIGIDAYPEDVRYVVDHFVGAERRFIRDTASNVSDLAHGEFKKAVSGNPFSKMLVTEPDSDRADNQRFRNLTEKAQQPKEVLSAIEAKQNGEPLNAAQKALVNRAESRTGMSAKQIMEINQAQKELQGLVRKNTKEGRPTDYNAFSRDAMKRFNKVGISGGFEKH